RSTRALRRPEPPAALSGVRVGGPDWFDDRLALAHVDPELFRRFDVDLAEGAAHRIHAIGEFDRVDYDISAAPDAPELVLDAHGKSLGPHLLLFGIDLVMDSAGEASPRLAFDGVASYVRTRIGARAAEWRVDLRAGVTSGVETALRQPLDFAGRWFVEPSALAVQVQRPVFPREAAETEYDTHRFLVGLDVGRALGLSGEMRAGVRGGRETSELDPAAPGFAGRFPTVAENAAEVRASIVVDRLDAVGIPRRGIYASATARASREELGAERSWATAAIDGRAYWSRGPHTVFARGAAGGSSPADRLPVHEEFLLGGFGSLAGHADGELRGEAFAVARAGWLRRVAELPPAFRAVVAGIWVEAGDAWEPSLDQDLDPRFAVTTALGVETLLGPIFLGWSRAESGRALVTLSLGRSP
ncbi:MAG TPA: BamA/TamA family outer membrane protein, partial [Gemmatimonadota bacterium]|nr:BamA/TamA family outer membrane protein [Gemmatimonadota bacterium]